MLEARPACGDVLRDKRRAVGEPLLLRGVVYRVGLDLARVGVDDLHDLPDAGRDRLVVDEAPAVPRLGRVRGGRSRIGRVEHREARARSVRVAGRVAEALRMRGHDPLGRRIVLAFLELAAHEGRRDVVVAEVADRLDEILLVVLESVVVEVDVAARAEQSVVREARVEIFVIVVVDCIALPRRVHAARDVDAVAERDAGVYSVGYERRLVELDIIDIASARSDDGKIREAHGHARVLHLPSVGDSVEVGVDRARVHAAAAEADGEPVVLGAAVYEAELGQPLVVGVGEHDAPHAALDVVGDSVEVSVGSVGVSTAGEDQQGEAVAEALHRSRIRREELVPPSLRRARMVPVDGFAVLVRVARVHAGVLVDPGDLVAVEVKRTALAEAVFVRLRRGRVRAAVHVEFPSVRDSVVVGVRAVVDHGALVAAGLAERLREGLRDRGGSRDVCGHGLRVVGSGDHGVDVVRIRRLAAEERPDGLLGGIEGAVCGGVGRIVDVVVAAVLEKQILVVRLVGTRVHGKAGFVKCVDVLGVVVRVPAARHVAFDVAPSRARIEAEAVADLVVHQREPQFDLEHVARVERLLLGDDAVDHAEAPYPVARNRIRDVLL